MIRYCLILLVLFTACTHSKNEKKSQHLKEGNELPSSRIIRDEINDDFVFVKISYLGPKDLQPVNDYYISNHQLDWEKDLGIKIEQAYDSAWVTRLVLPKKNFGDLVNTIFELYDRPSRIVPESILKANITPYGFTVSIMEIKGQVVFTDNVLMKENCEWYFTQLTDKIDLKCKNGSLLVEKIHSDVLGEISQWKSPAGPSSE